MKLISLNIWGGQLYQPLVDFLNKYKDKVDLFCFQETFKVEGGIRNLNSERIISFRELERILINFNGYFEDYIAPGEYNKEGLALFCKKDIQVKDQGEIFLYNPPDLGISNKNPESLWRNLQHVLCNFENKEFLVANMHGLFDYSTKTHKNDTPDRIVQSKKAAELLNKFNCPKILCGDLNLWPDTESMKILERGMRNLVKEFDIMSTRSKFFKHENKFADYVLVSPELKVNDFKAISDIVSDHLPLYLDFELIH